VIRAPQTARVLEWFVIKIKALLSKRVLPSKRALLLGLGGLGGLLLLGGGVLAGIAFWPQPEPEPPPPPLPAIVLPERHGPVEQQKFLAAIEAGRKAYAAVADNPDRLAVARAARAQALCDALKGRVAIAWTGTIVQASVNADKLGAITIQIGPGVTVKTWNTAAADSGFSTLMDPKSPMFLGAEFLGRNTPVMFSGNFFNSSTDCVAEGNLSIQRTMTEPDFILYFAELRPLRMPTPPADVTGSTGHDKAAPAKAGADKQAKTDKPAKSEKH